MSGEKMTPELKQELLDKLRECFDSGISFCGCYEGDIDGIYPEAVNSMLELFSQKLDEIVN